MFLNLHQHQNVAVVGGPVVYPKFYFYLFLFYFFFFFFFFLWGGGGRGWETWGRGEVEIFNRYLIRVLIPLCTSTVVVQRELHIFPGPGVARLTND